MVNLRAYRHLLFAVLLWIPIAAWSQEKDDLRNLSFFTESYPPANFLVNDNITGYAVDILLEASRLVGEPIEMNQLTMQPWARSYRRVLTQENSVLFSTTRSEHRENLFQWAGPIADIKVVVLARKDSGIEIEKPMDMASYRIGVIRDDIGEQSLLAMGIPRDSMQEASYVTVLAEQLMKKRIDLLVYSQRAAFWWSRQVNVDPEMFQPVYIVREGEVYFAFNKSTSTDVVEKLQRGLDLLKSTQGESGMTLYEEILAKY